MRHTRFALAATILVLVSAAARAQPTVPFADAGIHAVQFIDASEGWAVGDDGVVWHSIDGGKNWERQKTGTRASLRGVHFLTPYTGWVVGRMESPCGGGSVGVMLKTSDGGIQWEEVGLNVLPGLHVVKFFDEKAGFVCGDGSEAFPAGMFTTGDGGKTWRPVPGIKVPSCRAADFFSPSKAGVVAGAWSRLGTISPEGVYRESDLDPLAGRTLHAVCTTTAYQKGEPNAYAAGDGGAVLTSSDGGRSWGFVNLGLPPSALAACDFRCVAAFGSHVWVAGKPGGFLLHSGNQGKSWEIQRLDLPLPINGMYFLNDQVGWLVGEFGVIHGTTDGGKTWKVLRAGAQRAAVLCLHASHRTTPLDVMAVLGHGEGYLCAAMGLMSADPATADPRRAGDAARSRQAMRLAGGASGDVGWAFPMSAPAAGLPPRELMASWDRQHDGKAAEQLLRQAVLAIRMWQPEVILTDGAAPDGPAADVLGVHAAKEAFKKAADPTCFPEQLEIFGLKVWEAKKIYALGTLPPLSPVRMDQSVFDSVLADSPRDFTEQATRILADDAAVTDRRTFTLIASRLQDAEKHTSIMEGIVLARAGVARRPEERPTFDPTSAEEKKKAAQVRRRLETLASAPDPEMAGADKVMAMLGVELKKLPDDTAARTAFAVATRYARDGKWAEAREVYGLLAAKYPGHPVSIEAFRWLVRYHASSEARRRTEIQQKLAIKNVSFDMPAGSNGHMTVGSGKVASAGGHTVQEDMYGLYSPEANLRWHQACLDLEPKIAAFGPIHSHDPAAWLCFLAARRQVGRHNDAISFVRDYFKHTPAAAAMSPGVDPWRDCLAAELWLTDRSLVAVSPKQVGACQYTEVRPMLDGKLDDACWRNGKPLPLAAVSSTSDRPDEVKAFAEGYRTEARFAYDERFLYIAVSSSHPAGQKVEPVAKRTRDADLTGHDRVDILLDLDRDYQTYYRFQVDHRGCLAEDCWGDRSWNPKYFVAFESTDTGWTAEIAIPLVELTTDRPSHGRAWAVNVSRIVPGKGIQSWSSPADDAPRPEGMGLLQFRADK
jgi:photosystem II stability/assembly factor-like uncharacterized protein